MYYTWYILSYENSVNPFPEVRYQIEGWKQYALAEIVETPDIVQNPICIQETGLKPKDALHIACAIHGKCRSFITTNKGILKKAVSIDGIEVVSPPQWNITDKITTLPAPQPKAKRAVNKGGTPNAETVYYFAVGGQFNSDICRKL